MKKFLISGLLCSLVIINSASAVERPTFAAPKMPSDVRTEKLTTPQGEMPTSAGKSSRVSDTVKAELKEYKAKKKALYDGLSEDAKKVLKKHRKRTPFSRTHKKRDRMENVKDSAQDPRNNMMEKRQEQPKMDETLALPSINKSPVRK